MQKEQDVPHGAGPLAGAFGPSLASLCLCLCLAGAASAGPGGLLAFVSDRDGPSSLFLVDSDGAAAPTNLTPSAPGDVLSPSWMPDGSSLIYYLMAPYGQTSGVYCVPVQGGPSVRIASAQGIDHPGNRLSVSPDGTMLLFESHSRIITLRIHDSATRDIGQGYYPAWTADGRILFSRLGAPRLFYIRADGSGEAALELHPPAVSCAGYR